MRIRESLLVISNRSPELDGKGNDVMLVTLRPFEFLPRVDLAAI